MNTEPVKSQIAQARRGEMQQGSEQRDASKAFASAVILAFGLIMPTNAVAHLGHLGELAGHGHLVGVVMGGVAAALAAALAIQARQKKATKGDETAEADDMSDAAETDGEQAHA